MSEKQQEMPDIVKLIENAKSELSELIVHFENHPEKLKDEKVVKRIHELENKVSEMMLFLKSTD